MAFRNRRILRIAVVLVVVLSGHMIHGRAKACGADFRVETRVFSGKDDKDESRNTTLFRGDVVYDFVGPPSVITLLDTARGKFTIIDETRRVKTELTTDQVLEISSRQRRLADKENDPLLTFCTRPKFKISEQKSIDQWTFSSPVMTYEVTSQSPSPIAIAGQYRQFADWYARLNSVVHRGGLPPMARLVVNQHLAGKDRIPKEVRLKLAAHPRFGNRELTIRSEHTFRTGLASSDLNRIEKADRHLATYRAISIMEYLAPPKTARR